MQFMTKKPSWDRRMVKSGLLGCMMVALGTNDLTAAECSWIVQPNEPIVGLGARTATYEIILDGIFDKGLLYGFTITDSKLAKQLTDNKIAELKSHARPLKVMEQGKTVVYQLSSDSALPRTIYLAVADEPVEYFEAIDARITPPRPAGTRGASDSTGPMPRRSVPGMEILSIEITEGRERQSLSRPTINIGFQLCAYQVSW